MRVDAHFIFKDVTHLPGKLSICAWAQLESRLLDVGPPQALCAAGTGCRSRNLWIPMLSTSNVAIQFGAKPLFEQVTVKFFDGNRYGLIGANGSGKSTLMKVLGRDLEPSAGEVMLQTGMQLGKLNQNQFGYEDERVLDVVMRGHAELWE